MKVRQRLLQGRPALLLAAACVLVLPAPLHSENEPDPEAVAHGEMIYARYCTACHGREGRGDGSLAPDLKVQPTDLTKLAEKNGGEFPFEVVARSVDGSETVRGHGTPDMPAWGDAFTRTEGTETDTVEEAIERLTHYIWSIQATSQK